MGPRFVPKIKLITRTSRANEKVLRTQYNAKQRQIEEAVKYCKENNCKGKKALSSGLFPLIKDHKTITRRLEGSVVHGNEKIHLSILLPHEEECLVNHAKNRARAMQPITRKGMTDLIMNTLRIRQAANKKAKGGRKYAKLSSNALKALSKGKLSKFFWQRFEAKYDSLTKKRIGHTSLARAIACTKEMAINHLDSLADELIRKGIMTNYKKVCPGVWEGDIDGTRVFNRDETPQAIRYGVDGSAKNLAYCGKGEKCSDILKENREFVTIEPFISLDGRIHVCHVIFAAAGITSAMAPKGAVEKIPNLLISVTENGYQNGQSCLESCKFFDQVIAKENVVRPIAMLTDGHSSRFDIDVLRFNQEKEMTSHVSPPDSTSTTQALDQINASLHSAYGDECDKFFRDNHINREVFMEVLGSIWSKWTSKEAIVKAFKRVGISTSGLSVDWMQQDKFTAAEAIIQKECATPKQQKEIWEVDSPDGVRKGSAEYFKRKCQMYQNKLKEHSETTISPDEIPGFLKIDKVKVPATKKAVRLTQIHGSMEASKILELREQAELALKAKEVAKEKKKSTKEEQQESFIRCKISCVCDEIVCKATGLKQCVVCQDIMKSQCTKSRCKVNGIKPLMTQCHFDVEKKFQGGAKSLPSRKRKLFEADDEESDTDCDTEDSISSDSESVYSDDTAEGLYATPKEMYGDKLSHKDVKEGMWVVVNYEEEKFLGKVQSKAKTTITVLCLEKPLGIREPQSFESGDGFDYDFVYATDLKPYLTQMNKDGKKGRKWLWVY